MTVLNTSESATPDGAPRPVDTEINRAFGHILVPILSEGQTAEATVDTPPASLLVDATQMDSDYKTSEPYDFPRPLVSGRPFESFALTPRSLRPGDTIRVFHGSDTRNQQANDLEVAQMVALGDNVNFSQEEFKPYFDHSFVIELNHLSETDEEETLGIMRITPYSTIDGLKTFHDLARITDQPVETIEANFMSESSCVDLGGVWDITTLALAGQTSGLEKAYAIHTLLAGLTDVSTEYHRDGALTHIVSENDPVMHKALRRFGYPLHDLNGYGEMFYDLGGVGEAMTCHPAFFRAGDFADNIRNPFTHHLRLLEHVLRVYHP